MSKSQLYLSQIAERKAVFIWLEQWCHWWLAPVRDRTNWLHHSALKPISFNQVQCGQLTCLHYHPGQRWDGAELPTASSHLQLRHNRREHCSDDWQAAWPSPGTEHLQNKFCLHQLGCFPWNTTYFWQAFVLSQKYKVQTTKHYSLLHWDGC